ncbi:mucin-2-like [Daphnia carinata]|uniref:mucin-2-like n=1 Tax=Daphnia carinata TaxID=120202 RepID=UPI0025798CE7|nr:mucin-2-like [Daphnia carinata]
MFLFSSQTLAVVNPWSQLEKVAVLSSLEIQSLVAVTCSCKNETICRIFVDGRLPFLLRGVSDDVEHDYKATNNNYKAPPTTTKLPTTTTKLPTTTTKLPPTTTKLPTTTTKLPTTTTKLPPTTTKLPTTTTKLPTTTTKLPPTTTKLPTTTTRLPTTTTRLPTTTTKLPTTTTKLPITTTKLPTTTTKLPTTTTKLPTTTTKLPPTTTNLPTTTTKLPTTTTKLPTTTTQLPTTTPKPAVTTTKPSTPTSSYCTISTCSVPSDNTLCKYSNTTWGTACQPAYPTASSVNVNEITTILQVHNDYRRKVAQGLETRGNPGPQPSASNMRQLIWDEELAVMAQTHAQQCVFKHDTCRDVSRFRVGQNIYVGGSSADNLGTSSWEKAVTAWYDEVDDMTSAYVTNFPASPPKVIGHYTQLVWANSYTVGCGVAYYQSTATFDVTSPYNRLYVCNYGPTGNFVNSPVYQQGTAGSACPAPTSNNNGLCA